MDALKFPLVSIIMPTYNVEKYIDRSLKSVMDQDYANWELMIADDGSSDKTVDIIRAYEIAEPRIHLIKLTSNRGAAHARNVALDHSQGSLVCFLDSDDWIEQTSINRRVRALLESNVDMVISGFTVENGKSSDAFIPDAKQVGIHSTPCSPLVLKLPLYLHTCTVKQEYLAKLRFDEGLTLSEDRKLLYDLYQNVSKFAIIDDATYHYEKRRDSITARVNSCELIRSVQVDKEIFAKERSIGYPSPSFEQYIRRLLATARYIYAENSNMYYLQTIKEELEINKQYMHLLRGTLRMRYKIFIQNPILYRLLSRLLTH